MDQSRHQHKEGGPVTTETTKPKRKKLWIISIAIAVVVIAVVATFLVVMNQAVGPPAPPNGPNVAIWNGSFCRNSGNCGYSPSVKTVLNGTTLTWTNNGMTHTVTSCDATHYTSAGCPSQNAVGLNSFDSGAMSDGATFTWTFTVKGTYYYYCTLHPWMQGEIIVQ